MKGVLAQSQIDALLQELSGGKVEIQNASDHKKVKEYDFKIPKKFTKEQLRSLVSVHETYARHLSSYLTGSLRTYCKVEVVSIEETRYYEYSYAMPESVLLGVLDLSPYPGTVVMSLSRDLAFSVIDKLLGGAGSCGVINREYTDIEMVIMERFYKNIITYLRDAWASVAEVRPVFRKFETDNSANIMHLDEIVVVLVLNVTIKDITGTLTLCLPFHLLESVSDKLYTKYRFSEKFLNGLDTEETKQAVLSRLYKTTIGISAILGDSSVYVNDILNLEVGDIIKLNQKVDDYVKVEIGEKVWFHAKLGVRNNKKAIKIIESAE